MKRNWIVIAFMFLLTVALWGQAASSTQQPAAKADGCACCNQNAKADAGTTAPGCCGGKDAKACSRKDGKSCCAGMKDGMKGMKMDAADKTQAMSCGKDMCKNGQCERAKNGKKCCDNCPGMTSGKTAEGK
jgi:hypothetical protein